METSHDDSELTSVELASLWNSYIFETMVHHVFTYFLKHVDDPDIKGYIEFVQRKTRDHFNEYIAIFRAENIPIPRGTTSEDINLNAPRLFTDVFYINYVKNVAKFALMQFASSYTECSREDIRKMFLNHLHNLEKADQLGTEIMASKGINLRPPHVPIPKEVNFVKQKNVFNSFFSKNRPLTILEVGQLFYNAKYNAIGKSLLVGFSQVAKSEDIRQNFLKGKELSNKYYKIFSDVLIDADITAPPSYDSEVLSSTESPFSDRLLLNHVTFLNAFGLGVYGMAMAQSQRNDLVAMYSRVMIEVMAYGNDCANLLIKNGWMEEPPLAPDRMALVKSSHQ